MGRGRAKPDLSALTRFGLHRLFLGSVNKRLMAESGISPFQSPEPILRLATDKGLSQ